MLHIHSSICILYHWHIQYRLDEGVEGSVVWGFSWLGGTCWSFCCKTRKEPAKCVYCVRCTLSPLCLKLVQDWPVISVSTWQQLRLGQIVWFGWLSAISHLACRVGEGGGVGKICLQSITQFYTTWPRWREQGGGLRSLPMIYTKGRRGCVSFAVSSSIILLAVKDSYFAEHLMMTINRNVLHNTAPPVNIKYTKI